MQSETHQLLDWYSEQARPFLLLHAPDVCKGLDQDERRLRASLDGLNQELNVCFLGNSGVGKSTLINALVADEHTVVPSGGVGPLTAQAIKVQFDSHPKIEVEYHGPGRLWQLVFGLESAWKNELGLPATSDDAPPEFFDADGRELNVQEPIGHITTEQNQQRLDRLKLAELLVIGSESREVDLRYVLDSLRCSLGYQRKWGTLPDDIDAERVERIKTALSIAKAGQRFARQGSPDELKRDLNDHACGFLAPLIKTLTVSWPSPLLSAGIKLIDLPGLGIVGDPRPEITRDFIRKAARVVVLVVDKSGVTEPVARLLRESEFFSRLLYGSDDPASNPVLLVAVTRIDDVASTQSGIDEDQTFGSHFVDACRKTREMVRSQLRGELEAVWSSDGEMSEAKHRLISALLNSLQVFPVSAPLYQKIRRGKRTEFDTAEQTNVPSMIEKLRCLREQQETQLRSSIQHNSDSLRDGVLSAVKLIEAEWSQDNRRLEEIESLREDLACFIAPLQRQFDTLRGQYREFLRNTVPNRISDLVKNCKFTARDNIKLYLEEIGEFHWATVKASMRHGGRFDGQHNVDLQREFALSFEAPIAETWGTEILRNIRKRTSEYAADCMLLVDLLAEWARQQGTRVQQDIVDAQLKQTKLDSARLNNVGREMVKEVLERNTSTLIDQIDGPIRQRCRRFLNSPESSGGGVKHRILEMFGQLAETVIAAAEPPAVKTLLCLFSEVEQEILISLEGQRDPLVAISHAIVTPRELFLERADAQSRTQILADAMLIIKNSPRTHSLGASA